MALRREENGMILLPKLLNRKETNRFLQKEIAKADHGAKHKRIRITCAKSREVRMKTLPIQERPPWEEGQAKLTSSDEVFKTERC